MAFLGKRAGMALVLACMHEPTKKRKFLLIDAVRGLLLMFSASIKAKIRSYKKTCIRFKVFTREKLSFLLSPYFKCSLWYPF